MNLADLQAEHRVWVQHNFPGQTPAQMIMGLAEELGELAHAQLKSEQNIRRNEDHHAAIRDAVGDLVIYLSSYCTTVGIPLDVCVQEAWNQVKDRDWVKWPETGRPPAGWTQTVQPITGFTPVEDDPNLRTVLQHQHDEAEADPDHPWHGFTRPPQPHDPEPQFALPLRTQCPQRPPGYGHDPTVFGDGITKCRFCLEPAA